MGHYKPDLSLLALAATFRTPRKLGELALEQLEVGILNPTNNIDSTSPFRGIGFQIDVSFVSVTLFDRFSP
jgi:hypothetical protein